MEAVLIILVALWLGWKIASDRSKKKLEELKRQQPKVREVKYITNTSHYSRAAIKAFEQLGMTPENAPPHIRDQILRAFPRE